MPTTRPRDWRIILFWTKLGITTLALVLEVASIAVTPSFPDILLTLVAAALWGLISLFFIFLVTNNRGYEHWILHLAFEVSNILTNFLAFIVVIIFAFSPSLGTTFNKSAGRGLALFASVLTLILCLVWISTTIHLLINERRTRDRILALDPPDAGTTDQSRGQLPFSDKHLRSPVATATLTETDTSSKGSKVELTERIKPMPETV